MIRSGGNLHKCQPTDDEPVEVVFIVFRSGPLTNCPSALDAPKTSLTLTQAQVPIEMAVKVTTMLAAFAVLLLVQSVVGLRQLQDNREPLLCMPSLNMEVC